jgi:flagellar motor protein MotB
MANKRSKPAEEKIPVPGWVVSFSDMVTLLLAFFVLLQAFAKIQDPELFFVGQGSFRRAIAGLGIPSFLIGKEDKPRRDHAQVAHPTASDPENPALERVISPDEDAIRQMFADLSRAMRNQALDVEQVRVDSSPPPVRFAPTSHELTPRAREDVTDWAVTLKANLNRPMKIYVVGIAAGAGSDRAAWELSARRAAAVGECLRQALAARGPAAGSWRIYALGAGRGGEWCRSRFGLTADGTSIGIAVLDEEEGNGG